jgi:membrane protein DedA with SNARE-associated domain
MLDQVANLVSGSFWGYLVILAVVAGDAVLPLLPSETVLIAGAVLAANGQMSLALIILAAALGAVAGDNVSYFLGDRVGEPAAKRLFKGEKSQKLYAWGSRMICEHTWVVAVARFIPGGRTATTFASGALEVTWREFIRWDIVGAALWAVYATLIGYLGGEAFQHSLWKPFLISSAIAVVIGCFGELLRRRSARKLERQGKLEPPTPKEQREALRQ